MTTWLVTGVTGLLGANAALALQGDLHVVGLARESRPLAWCPNIITGDLLDPQSLRRAVEVVQPDVILHCAALAHHGMCEEDPELADAVNVEGTRALRALTEGRTFVYISTDTVFSGSQGGHRETDAVAPTTVYGETKARAEELVLESADSLVIRTNFFGWSPSGRRSILEFFVERLRQGDETPGFTNYRVASIFSAELLAAVKSLVEMQARGIVHVASSDTLSKFEFGVSVAEAFECDPGLIAPALSPMPDRDLSLNCDRASLLLGRSLPTQRDGIKRARQEGSPF
jgi:dTDP-4-dehydrorhamnose reductase